MGHRDYLVCLYCQVLSQMMTPNTVVQFNLIRLLLNAEVDCILKVKHLYDLVLYSQCARLDTMCT